MNSEDIRNLILAVALSMLVLIGWTHFFPPKVDANRTAANPATQAQTTSAGGAAAGANGASAPSVGAAAAPSIVKSRSAAIAASPRVAIDTPSLSGSIALTGGLIDDVVLKGYRETVDPKSPNITLFSPSGAPTPTGRRSSDSFLKKVAEQIQLEAPDLIVFTGDLISYSRMHTKEKLIAFLKSIQEPIAPPLGAFAILGNHDYSEYVSDTADGKTRKVSEKLPILLRGFARLFSFKDTSCLAPEVVDQIPQLPCIQEVYDRAGFYLLNNETVQIGSRFSKINLTGLGCHMAKQCHPLEAFQKYEPQTAGIVLSHSPDSFPLIQSCPGDLFLFGHTHGGLVNLPYIWKKVTYLKNKRLKKGLFRIKDKFLYINRGIGAPFPFRWFAPPEITVFTLVRGGPVQESAWQHLFPEETSQETVCSTP